MVKICTNCGAEMILKEKEGSKFWGCKNWATKGCKTQRYNGNNYTPKKPTNELNNSSLSDFEQFLIDEIKNINDRIDNLGIFLREKLK